jgi:hypothetical protein
MIAEPENTGQKQVDSRFKPGQSGNPAGRPKGSRNKLSEAFISDFCALWAELGADALRRVATDDPASFVRVAASLLPKQFEHSGPDGGAIEVEGHLKTTDLARRVSAIIEEAARTSPGSSTLEQNR